MANTILKICTIHLNILVWGWLVVTLWLADFFPKTKLFHRQLIQPSLVPSAASGEAKKSKKRERWSFEDEKVLLQLWADNIEKVERKRVTEPKRK